MRFWIALGGLFFLAVHGHQASAQAIEHRIKISELESGVDASFRGLAVRDINEAWVSGSSGTVIRTTDAGISWQQVQIPGTKELDFRDVELLPGGVVLLMSAGEGEASTVRRSVDNGQTWRTVLINREPKGFFDGMAFDEDGQSGLLYGDPIDGRLEIYKTSDAGESWIRLPESRRPTLKEGEYGFAASGTGIVTRGSHVWIATGGSVARVWHSQDSGITWKPSTSILRSGNASSGIFSIEAFGPRNLIAIGGNYLEPDLDTDNVAVSSDSGESWSRPVGVKMRHKACVQSLGGNALLACGRTGIALSTDAGQTWKSISNDSYYTLAVDSEFCSGFLAGKDGRVARFQRLITSASPTPDNPKTKD